MRYLKKKIDCDFYNEIIELREEIKTLENIFNNTTNPEVIEACIYNIKALNSKQSYYLSKIRNNKKISLAS